jgi:alcohol dehydrogenase
VAAAFGATTVHLTEDDVRASVKEVTEGRGADVTVDAVGHPEAFDLACRLTRKAGAVSVVGVYAERMEVHMAMVWLKSLTIHTGHANVIAHVDGVLDLMQQGKLNPLPLVTHHMKLEDAPEAYAVYDRREALKIVMAP